MTFPVPIFAACKPGIFLAKILPPPVGSCKRQFLPFIRKRSGSNSRFEPNHVIKSNRSAMMYSARSFRCYCENPEFPGISCRTCTKRNSSCRLNCYTKTPRGILPVNRNVPSACLVKRIPCIKVILIDVVRRNAVRLNACIECDFFSV